MSNLKEVPVPGATETQVLERMRDAVMTLTANVAVGVAPLANELLAAATAYETFKRAMGLP